MSLELLKPVAEEVVSSLMLNPKKSLGNYIQIHTDKNGFPDLELCEIAIIGLTESRNSFFPIEDFKTLDFRKSFYKLFPGNWKFRICDIGDLPDGKKTDDTYFALTEICLHLRQLNIVSIIIGGSHDLIYPMYQSYKKIKQFVNIVSVDNQFDFSQDEELISGKSYMSKIIMEQPNYLFNYYNLGYQSYLVPQEEIDLMKNLYFESLRLGIVLDELHRAEPFFRDADIAGFDMKSLSWRASNNKKGNPNGIDERTICALARYAGISDRLNIFGIFELPVTTIFTQLLAQVVWYFIEGYNCRFDEYPPLSAEFKRYNVTFSDMEIVFYQSKRSKRWWVEVINQSKLDNKNKTTSLLPCTHEEYIDACNDILPDRWLNATKRY